MHTTRGRWRIEALAATAVAIAWSAILILHVGDEHFRQWLSNLSLCAMPFLAGLACFWRASKEAGRARVAWICMGGAAISWGCGQTIWTYYESFEGRDVPFPSYADLGYLGAVPLLVAGLMLLSSVGRQAVGVARTVLDGLVVATGLLIVSWQVVLEKTFQAGGDTLLAQVISLSYPIGDIVCGSVAIVVIARTRNVRGLGMASLYLLAAGTVSFAVGDSGFTFLTLKETYYSGHPIDIGWFCGYLLLALAARAYLRDSAQPEVPEAEEHRAPVGVFAPYVPVLLAIVAASYREFTANKLGIFLAWAMLILIVLVVIHQILATFENVGLNRSLQARTNALSERERWFRSLVQNSSDVVTVVDERGRIQYQTPSVKRVFGYEPDSLIGHSLDTLVPPSEAHALQDALARAAENPGSITEFSIKMRDRYGEWCDTESTVTSLVDDPNVRGLVLNTRDASAQKQLEERLSHQAFHDALTGLANRELFFDRVGHALERARREVRTVAVLFVDMDGFKGVNDSLGHARGDELLVLIAERFAACVRPGDTVARIGGDEFAVLLEAADDSNGAVLAGHRLRDVLDTPFMIDGREVLVRASIGVAATDDGHTTADELVRNADLAMYRAKTNNGGLELFEIGMHTALVRRLELENDLRHALERNELVLHYQPVLDLATSKLTGAEALIRWKHPSGELLSAMDFVPLAEETGLIAEIGAWVLREACTQAALWQVVLPEADRSGFRVAVNLSGRQLVSNSLIETIERALAETGLDPTTLVLEMTESVMIGSNAETVCLLAQLKGLGVRLAIDDFGTGYSSLSYLSRFPVDLLKIDRSFVEKLAFDPQSAELVQTIVQLGRTLDLQTVAEGIETVEQLDALRRIGCEFGQGYLFSNPVPAREITMRLRAGSTVFNDVLTPELVMAAGTASGHG